MAGHEERELDAAAALMLEAEELVGLRTFSIGEERAAVLAVRAGALSEYVCAVTLVLADRERSRAAALTADADRRRPSGRRAHTLTEVTDLRERAAQRLERAAAAEALAIAAVDADDVDDARHQVVHVLDGSARVEGSLEREWHVALEVAERLRRLRRTRRLWTHVRGRAAQASQPRGGLLPLASFDRHEFGGDQLPRQGESGPPGTIASAVELLARWDLVSDPRSDGEPSAAALEAIRAVRRGEHADSVYGLLGASGRVAASEDELEEASWQDDPLDLTLDHISEMGARVSGLFVRFGRPLRAETWPVSAERFRLDGFIDFVTADTIWDLKVSTTPPDRVDVLQLLLYWAVLREDPASDVEIASLGLYNPRLDTAWTIEVSAIPLLVRDAVESLALRVRP